MGGVSIIISMRKTDKENAIVVCTIVLCIMLTLGLCYFLSGEGILNVFSDKDEGEEIYAVVTGGYSDMTLARSNAELIRNRGGAGYTLDENGTICVVIAVYKDSDSAQRVLNNLDDSGAYIKTINISTGNFKWCDKSFRNDVSNALGYFPTAFDTLYNTANKLNENAITLVDANTQIKVLRTQIEDIKSVFYQKSSEYQNDQVTQIKLALVTTLALIDNIETSSTLVKAVSSIRYQLVQLVLCRQALMRSI